MPRAASAAPGAAAVLAMVAMAACRPDPRPVHAPPVADWTEAHAGWCTDPAHQPASPPAFKDPVAARYHMRRHFHDLRIIEQLLLAGKLYQGTVLAQLLAREVDDHGDPGLAHLRSFGQRVRAAALDLSKATAMDEALRREPRVAAACASCHVEAQGAPLFGAIPLVPRDDGSARARMARHVWAVDRLWEGMIGPADERWTQGLAVLSDTPVPFSRLTDAPALGERLQQLARTQLAARAATSIDERATAYGEMLVTCSACHASLRVRLR